MLTVPEYRKSKEYEVAKEKIRNYRKGFIFTLKYGGMPEGKAKALQILTADCVKEGLLIGITVGLSLEGDVVEERFKRV